jgi:hypothetical protein
MTAYHIPDMVFRAATFRAMHRVSSLAAFFIAVAIGGSLYLARGRRGKR